MGWNRADMNNRYTTQQDYLRAQIDDLMQET